MLLTCLLDYLFLSSLKMSCMLLVAPAAPADLLSKRKTLCMRLPALALLAPAAEATGDRLSSLKMPWIPAPSRLSSRYAPAPLYPPSNLPPKVLLLSSRKMLWIPLLRLTGEGDLRVKLSYIVAHDSNVDS